MRNKLKIYLPLALLLIAFLSSYTVFAQEFGSNLKSSETPSLQSTEKTEGFKPDVKVSLGTSFTSFAPGFNTFGTYIAPEVSMPVSKKVEMSFGMAYSSMFYSSPGQSGFSSPNNYGSIYVSGTYHVNEKISIRGTGYKTFLLNPSNFSENNNSSYFDFSSQGAILDLEYRVTDNFRINASFHYREQNYPDYYFGNPMNSFGSPNSFNSGFGGSGFGGFGPGF